MIEETIFINYDEIIKFVKDNYGIDIFKVDKINRGSANIYSLNDNLYILKEFQSKYTKREIDKEIEIINHLRNDNIPVPEYVPLISNEYSTIYKDRVIIMQKYIDGYTMESNTGSEEQVLESGFYLGKIIKSLEKSDIELDSNDISDWYSKNTIDERLNNKIS